MISPSVVFVFVCRYRRACVFALPCLLVAPCVRMCLSRCLCLSRLPDCPVLVCVCGVCLCVCVCLCCCLVCAVKGAWSCWSTWSQCSVPCGGGHYQRTRSCTNPPPSLRGDICIGLHTEEALCNTHACQGKLTSGPTASDKPKGPDQSLHMEHASLCIHTI